MAGRAYSVFDQQAVTTPLDTLLTIQGSATLQVDIFYCAFSIITDELDDMIQWTLARFDTADGTGAGLTPTPFEDNDIASQTVCLGNHTAEPTYPAGQSLLDIGVNTRSFQQWYAQPGREFTTAAGANEGIGLGALHGSSTPTALGVVHFVE